MPVTITRISLQTDVNDGSFFLFFICSGWFHCKQWNLSPERPAPVTQLHTFTPGSCPVPPQSDMVTTKQLHRGSLWALIKSTSEMREGEALLF